MKIWIDFINTPQVSFFEPLISELEGNGHEFILTCRDSSNTVQLLNQKKWKYHIIGNSVKKSTASKFLAFPKRVKNLVNYIKMKKVDVAIGQSSFYLPIASKIMGIPSIYTNDNEHALGNIPSFFFATKILLPESMAIKKAMRQGASKTKIIQYPGIKEGVYLWAKGIEIQNRRKLHKSTTIYIRPEPQTAQYYSGKLNFMDNLLLDIKDKYNITILARDKNQLEHYSQPKFMNIKVPSRTIEFSEVAIDCLLFIGAGGSMTREMAIMGVPTISVYQGELLDVDRYLIEQNLMKHEPNLTKELMEAFLIGIRQKPNNDSLISKGKSAYQLIHTTLLDLNEMNNKN